MVTTGDAVFVLVVAVLTLLLSFGSAILFVLNFSVKQDRNRSWWKVAVCIFVYLQIVQPLAFLAVDILDTQLSLAGVDTPQRYTSQSSVTSIQASSIWKVLYAFNFLLAQFGIVFMISFLSNTYRPTAKRFGIATGYATITMGSSLAATGLLYLIPGSVETDYYSEALMSGTTMFSVNETIAGCVMPTQLVAYNNIRVSSAVSHNATTKDAQACTSFPSEGIETPTAAFPASFGYLDYTLAVFGIFGYLIMMPHLAVGLVAYPYNLMTEFIRRPKEPMTKRAYIQTVRQWCEEARQIKLKAAKIENETNLTGTTWAMRKELHALRRQVTKLEVSEAATAALYPQATSDPDVTWTFHILAIYSRGAFSIIAVALSIGWILNVCLYVIPLPPVSPWLNALVSFSEADNFSTYLLNVIDLLFTQLLTFHVLRCVSVGLEQMQKMVPFFQVESLFTLPPLF
mmetsp:Transcript_30360/g.85787  ORF Transcript_30360/g.85787 Transcript_30360/m.85787 type:complete len:457 (-) Transcript_30360:689-2059(-)